MSHIYSGVKPKRVHLQRYFQVAHPCSHVYLTHFSRAPSGYIYNGFSSSHKLLFLLFIFSFVFGSAFLANSKTSKNAGNGGNRDRSRQEREERIEQQQKKDDEQSFDDIDGFGPIGVIAV